MNLSQDAAMAAFSSGERRFTLTHLRSSFGILAPFKLEGLERASAPFASRFP